MTNHFCEDDNLTDQEKWHKIVGTDHYGNLPEHKKHQHDGHCWAPCPYSTQATDMKTRHLLGLTSSGILPSKVLHVDENGREYFMKTSHSGDWGFTCTYSGCGFLLANNRPYFYR